MPLTTTEVPTYFGPADSPLFGVLHLPIDQQIRSGILICGSLGKEGMDSVRLQRILAHSLASLGFGVLHFDYLGTGDSAYAQARDDAVTDWTASVAHALDYLAQIGAESTTAIGIRAGCLILDQYLTQSYTHPDQSKHLNRMVYLDPPGTGRRYLREHSALYRLSIGADADKQGEVSIIGARFSDHAAADFTKLRLDTDPVSAYGLDDVLVVGRPAEAEKRITTLMSAAGVDSMRASGLPECAQPRETLLPIPFNAVSGIVEWIDGCVPTHPYPVAPQYLPLALMPAEGPAGARVVERIELIGPNGVFAIRTLPAQRELKPMKTVVFFVTANDSHVGPAREWVELSRRLASAGSQALRWAPTGLGLSGEVSRNAWRPMYSKRDINDSIAVAKHACKDAGELELVGICSGSWYAAQAARSIGARSVILINLLAWNWRLNSTLLSQLNSRKKTLEFNAASETGGPDGGAPSECRRNRLAAFLRLARQLPRKFMHQHCPRQLLRVLSRIGLVWLPEDILTTLAHRRVDVTVIASPSDADLFAAKGGAGAIDRLQSATHPPRLITPSTGDHASHHPAILSAIRDAVSPLLADYPSRVTPPATVIGPTAARHSV